MAVSEIDPLKMNKWDVLDPCQNAVFIYIQYRILFIYLCENRHYFDI